MSYALIELEHSILDTQGNYQGLTHWCTTQIYDSHYFFDGESTVSIFIGRSVDNIPNRYFNFDISLALGCVSGKPNPLCSL